MSRLIFYEKKKKKIECCLLEILLGTLRVNLTFYKALPANCPFRQYFSNIVLTMSSKSN